MFLLDEASQQLGLIDFFSCSLFQLQTPAHFIIMQPSEPFPGPFLNVVLLLSLQALGSMYFIHKKLKNIYQYDFNGKNFTPFILFHL